MQSIYESVSSTARFVKKDKKTKTFSVVDDLSARQKISHAIRYRKSTLQHHTVTQDQGEVNAELAQSTNSGGPIEASVADSKPPANMHVTQSSALSVTPVDGQSKQGIISDEGLFVAMGGSVGKPHNVPSRTLIHRDEPQHHMPEDTRCKDAQMPQGILMDLPSIFRGTRTGTGLSQVDDRGQGEGGGIGGNSPETLDSEIALFLLDNFFHEEE